MPRVTSSTVTAQIQGISRVSCRPCSRLAAARPRKASTRTVVSSRIGKTTAYPSAPRGAQAGWLADTSWVAATLGPDPAGGIGVPLVPAVGKRPEAGLDVFPSPLVVERAAQGLADEHAATPPADTLVELLDEAVIDAYVQSHGHKLAHNLDPLGGLLMR